jgi:hypothetical protein
MLQAVETPVLKVAAVAGAALALLVGFKASEPEPSMRRLVLHAPEQCNAIYLTRWEQGEVIVTSEQARRPLTFKQRAFINDGCEWLGIEQLTPTADGGFAYTYDEEILSCQPGATPAIKTPRTGYVTVEVVR